MLLNQSTLKKAPSILPLLGCGCLLIHLFIYGCMHTWRSADLAAADVTPVYFSELTRIMRDRVAVFTCHGVVLLLQCSGVDDASEEASVADSVLFPLVALVQQLVVQEEQLAAQRVKLIQRSRAWGSHNNNAFNRITCLTHIHSSRKKLKCRVPE